jgi:alpha-L-rhamnosidase
MEVSVPVNTTATIYVTAKKSSEIKESGQTAEKTKGVVFLGEENGKAVFKVGSGNYVFRSNLN